MLSTFNALEAAIAGGVRRFVNFSSETVPGFIFAQRPFKPGVPPDRRRASGQAAGSVRDREVVRRAPVRRRGRAGGHPLHVDPPCWVQDEGSYERNLGPIVREPQSLIANYCSYVDVYDLCDAVVLAIETDLPGHEVFYIARRTPSAGTRSRRRSSATTAARASSFESWRAEASAISSAKAERLLAGAEAVVARLSRRAGHART